MTFYSTRLLYLILVDDGKRRRRLRCDETVVVFRARDDGHAQARALALGKATQTEYTNHKGERVRWALAKVLSLDRIAHTLDGAEVSSRLHHRLFPRPVSARAQFHPERTDWPSTGPVGLISKRSRRAHGRARAR